MRNKSIFIIYLMIISLLMSYYYANVENSLVTVSNSTAETNMTSFNSMNDSNFMSIIHDKAKMAYSLRSKPAVNAMWLWGSYINRTNLVDIKAHGINNIIVHEDVFTRNSYDDACRWINEANDQDIKVHVWIQCFYKDGHWIKPVLEDGSYNTTRFNEIVDKAKTYAKIANVAGIHLDYLRYPGTAYRANGGYMNACNAIAELTSEVNSEIKEVNPNIISSAAIMPEYEDAHYYNETMPNDTNADAYYYGQDIGQLGNILDWIVPMVYKGNYNKDSFWIGYTTKWFVDNSPKAKVITGLQGYISDDNPIPLSTEELSSDATLALDNGAYGVCVFRYSLFNYISYSDNKTSDGDTTPLSTDEITGDGDSNYSVLHNLNENDMLPIHHIKTGFPLYFLTIIIIGLFYGIKK